MTDITNNVFIKKEIGDILVTIEDKPKGIYLEKTGKFSELPEVKDIIEYNKNKNKNKFNNILKIFKRSKIGLSHSFESFFTLKQCNPLIHALGEHLNQPKDIILKKYDEIINTTLYENGKQVFSDIKKVSVKGEGYDAFKMVFCFACDYSEKMVPALHKSKEKKGGDGSLSRYFKKSCTTGSKFLMYVVCIMGFIYFTFGLFESYRLFMSSMDQIIAARATYQQHHPSQDTEIIDGYMDYLNSFFKVMYEIGCGNLIQLLDVFKTTALENAKDIFRAVATEGSRTQYARCTDSLYLCINGYLTGSMQQEANTAMRTELDYNLNQQYIHATHRINMGYNEMVSNMNFATTSFITSINGLFFCTILLGSIVKPQIYTPAHLVTSMAALQGSYLGGTSFYSAISTISTHGGILFRPDLLTSRLEPSHNEEPLQIEGPITGGKRRKTYKNRSNRKNKRNKSVRQK